MSEKEEIIETTAEELVETKEEKPGLMSRFKNWCHEHPVKATLLGVATGGVVVTGIAAGAAALINHISPCEDEEYEEEDPDENEVEDKTNNE
jgi:hypothetical protein